MITTTIKIPLPQGQSIAYEEVGINHVWLHLIREKNQDEVTITMSVAEDQLSAEFGAMTMGKVFHTMSLVELLSLLKERVDITENTE